MTQYPWNRGRNTSDEIADEDDPRYETPGGAANKIEQALEDAKEYTDAELLSYVAQTLNLADDSVTRPKIAPGAVGATELDPSLLDYTTDIAVAAKFNEVDAQLADTAPFLDNGRVILPSGFPILPFGVFKNKQGDYYSDATPYTVLNWSDADQIYITCTGTPSVDGKNYKQPITLSLFRANFVGGTYGAQKKFVLNFLDYVYYSNASNSNGITLDFDADLLLRPMNASNFTWFGRFKNSALNGFTSAWASDSGVYKTTQSTNHDVLDVVNLSVFDDFGMPSPYQKVATLAECQATKGTFYRSAADVWCNPLDTHAINDILLLISSSLINENQANARVTAYSNMGFGASAFATATGGSLSAKFYYFGCKFYRALANGLYKAGVYKVHSFDCISAYATLDCFNYHTTDKNSVATEVNCIGYGAGKYKLTTGNPTHSNNGSTAHDGMSVFRIGSRYYECEGPIVADVNNCYSISIGCEASSILSSSTGIDAAFSFDNVDSADPEKPKYVIECAGFGNNVQLGINGTNETRVANFNGVSTFAGNVKKRGEFTW